MIQCKVFVVTFKIIVVKLLKGNFSFTVLGLRSRVCVVTFKVVVQRFRI